MTEVSGEPIRSFDLAPEDFAGFVRQFIAAGVPILSISFQGYEVTLPESWPYLEAVFGLAKQYSIRRSFITNGMLLPKRATRIDELDPARISVSLDGASASVNDPLRGLSGAFDATLRGVETFLTGAPRFRSRMAIASTLYGEQNVDSLLGMPALLKRIGISRWVLAAELCANGSYTTHVNDTDRLFEWLKPLQDTAASEGITCHFNDELGVFQDRANELHALRAFDPAFVYRMDPMGYVRKGHQLFNVWRADPGTRWDPRKPRCGRSGGLLGRLRRVQIAIGSFVNATHHARLLSSPIGGSRTARCQTIGMNEHRT